MSNIKKRGGFRHGSGRKKGESSTVVRVPDGILLEVKRLIDTYKSNPEPPKASVRLVCNDFEGSTKNPMSDWKAKPMPPQKRAKAKALRKKKRKK